MGARFSQLILLSFSISNLQENLSFKRNGYGIYSATEASTVAALEGVKSPSIHFICVVYFNELG